MAAWADVNLAGLVGPSLKKGKENNYEPYGVELYQRVCEREEEGLPRRGVGYIKNRLLNKERDVCVCVCVCTYVRTYVYV